MERDEHKRNGLLARGGAERAAAAKKRRDASKPTGALGVCPEEFEVGQEMDAKPIPMRIVEYLREHGPMSGRDITADLDVRPWDVMLAAHEGLIQRCAAEPGGVDPWYEATTQGAMS